MVARLGGRREGNWPMWFVSKVQNLAGAELGLCGLCQKLLRNASFKTVPDIPRSVLGGCRGPAVANAFLNL